jgi:hypothetical protein
LIWFTVQGHEEGVWRRTTWGRREARPWVGEVRPCHAARPGWASGLRGMGRADDAPISLPLDDNSMKHLAYYIARNYKDKYS